MATPTTSDFLVVPINGTDLIAFYRGSNISRPLYLSYSNFLAILTQAISGGTKILLQTNSVDNPAQNVLNLIEGTGISLVATAGGVTISANSGTSFITAISDTLDIDLTVTSSTLSAALTTTGVTANTYGTGTTVPQITVDSKGRITGVTNVAITALGTGTVTSVGVNPGFGITATISGTATINPTINITNSKPDIDVGITGGDTIGVSGAYPNFTLRTNVTTTQRLLGRYSAGAGAYEEIIIGTNLTLSGNTLSATGGTGGTYTVNNGLEPQSGNPNNFQLGGALTKNTTITASSGNQLNITSTTTVPLNVSTTASGQSAINLQSTDGLAILALSDNSVGMQVTSGQGNYAASLRTYHPTTNNTVLPIIEAFAFTGGFPTQNGFGASIDFRLLTTNFGTNGISNKLISKWTDATHATRTSQFEITTVNNAVESTALTLKGTGQLQLNNYTAPFSGTAAYALGVDASGNVITTTASGGTVTGVTATSPITSSEGTAPVISTSMATNKLIGRYSPSTGVMEEVIVGDGLNLTAGGQLNNTATPTPLGYYGQYFSYTTQNATTANVGIAMYFDVPDIYNGISVVTDGTALTKITFANTGIYNLQFSTQFQNTDNAEQDVYIWLRKNGITAAADVGGSTGIVSVPKTHGGGGGTPGHVIATWNFLLDIVAGDFYQIVWSTSDVTKVSIKFLASTVNHPSTASTLFTVTQQSGIMAGTGITAINSLTAAAQTLASTDLNISSSVATHTFSIANNAVTYAKMQNASAIKKLLGSNDASASITEIILGTNLTMVGNTLNASGGGGITALTTDVTASGTGSVAATLDANYKAGSAGVTFDGGGAVISNGKIAYVRVPYKGTITAWYIASDVSGACSILVQQGLAGVFPPATTIFTAALPSGRTATNTVSVNVAAGDYLAFTISGVSTVTWVNLSLSITKIL